jgi:pyruvate/2-oxoglutarate dehydrogenase complex dihydrolipoamide acyltransferase (E2) component
MRYNVLLPQLTETMEEATILTWFKQAGDYVGKKEKLFEVETDKTTMEVESLDSGYVCEILAAAGQVVAVGTVLAVLADSKEDC